MANAWYLIIVEYAEDWETIVVISPMDDKQQR